MRPRLLLVTGLLLFAVGMEASRAQAPGPNNAITDVPGITVGQYTGADTGATVVLAASPTGQGVAGGVTQRGGSPVTRETDLMRPDNMVEVMNAVVLGGGSSFGLAVASGVMRCLEGRGIGFSVGGGNVVPIVQAAMSFDRATCGAPTAARPDFSAGLQACADATGGPVAQGNVGAGTGAIAGGVKGGTGTASVVLPNGIIVGAIVSVNSEGAPYDANGNLYAAGFGFPNEFGLPTVPGRAGRSPPASLPGGALRSGTTAVVATNVTLTKSQATKIAEMADDGVSRAINPAHTAGDGDTLFVLGTARVAMETLGETNAVITQLGTAAANTVTRAIVNALLAARSTSCQPSYCVAAKADCRR